MVKAGIDQKRFPNEVADSIRTINSLAKPRRLGFAISLYKKYESNPGRHNIDVARIGRTLYRIVRGLFYHNTKIRLAESVTFKFLSINDQPTKAAALTDVISALTKQLTTIGDGIFRYSFEQFQPLTLATVWLMTFYDHQKFLCFITPLE